MVRAGNNQQTHQPIQKTPVRLCQGWAGVVQFQ